MHYIIILYASFYRNVCFDNLNKGRRGIYESRYDVFIEYMYRRIEYISTFYVNYEGEKNLSLIFKTLSHIISPFFQTDQSFGILLSQKKLPNIN